MRALNVLLAALGTVAGWQDKHKQDEMVVTLSVPAGESYVEAARKLTRDCGIEGHLENVLAAFRARYHRTVTTDTAPYRMDLTVTTDPCRRQEVSMTTGGGWRHSFGDLWFDQDDEPQVRSPESRFRASWGGRSPRQTLRGAPGPRRARDGRRAIGRRGFGDVEAAGGTAARGSRRRRGRSRSAAGGTAYRRRRGRGAATLPPRDAVTGPSYRDRRL